MRGAQFSLIPLLAWLALLVYLAGRRRWLPAFGVLLVPVCLLGLFATSRHESDVGSGGGSGSGSGLPIERPAPPISRAERERRLVRLASDAGFDAMTHADAYGVTLELRGPADSLDDMLASVERDMPDLRLLEMGWLEPPARGPGNHEHYVIFGLPLAPE